MNRKAIVEPKLFGSHRCRICDQTFDYQDMHPGDTGLCRNCMELIQKGLIDKSGKEIE